MERRRVRSGWVRMDGRSVLLWWVRREGKKYRRRYWRSAQPWQKKGWEEE